MRTTYFNFEFYFDLARVNFEIKGGADAASAAWTKRKMSGDCGSRKRSPADAFVASIGLSDAPPCAPAKRGPGRPEGPRSQRQPKPACSEGADKRAAKALVLGLDYEYKQVAKRKLWLKSVLRGRCFPGEGRFRTDSGAIRSLSRVSACRVQYLPSGDLR